VLEALARPVDRSTATVLLSFSDEEIRVCEANSASLAVAMRETMQRKFRSWMGRFGVALALALTAGTAVLAQDVTTNFQPGTDFSKYKGGVHSEPNRGHRNPDVHGHATGAQGFGQNGLQQC
jgi:hypothetical protein